MPEEAKLMVQQENIQPFQQAEISAKQRPCHQRKSFVGDTVVVANVLSQAAGLFAAVPIAQSAVRSCIVFSMIETRYEHHVPFQFPKGCAS